MYLLDIEVVVGLYIHAEDFLDLLNLVCLIQHEEARVVGRHVFALERMPLDVFKVDTRCEDSQRRDLFEVQVCIDVAYDGAVDIWEINELIPRF